MSTVTVVPTVDMASNPPRVQLVVTDVGTPNLFAATVTRLDPDGVWRNVRTPDGNPLVLTTSGANRVGTLSDYEAPYGTPVTYSTLESAGTVSAPVTVNETRAWLVDPEHAGPVRHDRAAQGLLRRRDLGRAAGHLLADGPGDSLLSRLTAPARPRRLPSQSKSTRRRNSQTLRALLSGAGVLLLNIPASLGFGFDTSYVAVGKVTNRRVSDIGTDPYRAVELPITVVDMPIGGSQSSRSYGDLMDFSSYAALSAGYASYTALLAGP
jgi:hypothetical protein